MGTAYGSLVWGLLALLQEPTLVNFAFQGSWDDIDLLDLDDGPRASSSARNIQYSSSSSDPLHIRGYESSRGPHNIRKIAFRFDQVMEIVKSLFA